MDDLGGGSEWADSTGMALMGLDFTFPGHFGIGVRPSVDDLDACWSSWVRGEWLVVRGALRQAHLAAHEQSMEGVLGAEGEAMTRANDVTRRRLGLLAERIVDGIKGAKHARFFDQYRARVVDGTVCSPAVAMAVRAATFHLPLFDTVTAWFYYEWRSAQAVATGAGCRKEYLSEWSLNAFYDEPEHVAAVVARAEDRAAAAPFRIVGHDGR